MSTTDDTQERHVPHPDTPTFEQIVAGLRTANVALDPDGQRHALTLLRTLARDGAPVSPVMLAGETGQTEQEAAAFIDRLPGVYRDDDSNVVGFWGLANATRTRSCCRSRTPSSSAGSGASRCSRISTPRRDTARVPWTAWPPCRTTGDRTDDAAEPAAVQ